MPSTVEFAVAGVSDKHLLAMIRSYCDAAGQSFTPESRIHIWGGVLAPMTRDPAASTKAGAILENSESRLIQQVTLDFGTTTLLIHQKKPGSGILDIQLNSKPDNKPSDEEFVRLLGHAKSHFHELAPGIAFQNILGEEANQHYAAREATILKLDQITQELFRKTAEVEKTSRDRIQEKETQLATEYKAKQDLLEAEHVDRLRELEESSKQLTLRESGLSDREKSLELQASRIERRNTIKTLISQLAPEDSPFQLEVSAGTRFKRIAVLGFTLVLLTLLICLNYFLYAREQIGTPNSFSWIRPTLASVSLLLAFVFFLKWLNNWADRHATEEFRLKRMLLDVRRVLD